MSFINITWFQDENPLQDLIDKAEAIKKAIEGKETFVEIGEALKKALDYANGEKPDPVGALSLFGSALSLIKEVAEPVPGAGGLIGVYADSVKAIANTLKKIALTQYDKMIDRYYKDTGDPVQAADLADKNCIGATDEDKLRGRQRVTLQHLEKTHPKEKKMPDGIFHLPVLAKFGVAAVVCALGAMTCAAPQLASNDEKSEDKVLIDRKVRNEGCFGPENDCDAPQNSSETGCSGECKADAQSEEPSEQAPGCEQDCDRDRPAPSAPDHSPPSPDRNATPQPEPSGQPHEMPTPAPGDRQPEEKPSQGNEFSRD